MSSPEKALSMVDALVAATKDKGVHHIVVHGKLKDTPSINLLPGQTLRGDGDGAAVIFAAEGRRLSSDNRVHNIHLEKRSGQARHLQCTSVESVSGGGIWRRPFKMNSMCPSVATG